METRLDIIAMTSRNLRYAALYRSVTLVLEAGVATALVLLAAGLAVNTFTDGAEAAVIMTIGILVLLATPALVVLITMVFFIILRDWWCLAASLAILTALTVSLVLALRI